MLIDQNLKILTNQHLSDFDQSKSWCWSKSWDVDQSKYNYHQAGWIGTGGVNRDTYHFVLAKAFILLYNILLFLENMSCQVNDSVWEGLKN